MGKQSERLDKARAKRLGDLVRRMRETRGLSAYGLAQTTGLSRSYMAYLESGKFADIGLDKFARLIEGLGESADQVLQEAGYLPKKHQGLPDPKTYLRTLYKLSPQALEQALAFLEFLVARERQKARGETRRKK